MDADIIRHIDNATADERSGDMVHLLVRCKREIENTRDELANEHAFNEGWQEHISDLLDAMKPFAALVKETNGNIPTNRLSFANWHALTKAFDAAVIALNIPKVPEVRGCECCEED